MVGVRSHVAGAALDGVVLGLSAGAGGVLSAIAHLHAVDLNTGSAGEVHHLGAQGVERHLSDLVPGHGGAAVGTHAVEQTNLVALADSDQHEAVAVVLSVLEVAQGAHHHGGGLDGSHGGGGIIDALAAAGHNAVGGTGAHPAPRPLIIAAHVGKGAGAHVVVVIQVQQQAHDDRHLRTVDGTVRTKAAVVADHDFDCLQNLDSFDVVVCVNVGVARNRTGADHHHAQEHDRGQSEAESPLQVSHSDFLLTKFFGLRGAVFWRKCGNLSHLVDPEDLTFLKQFSPFYPKISRFFNISPLPPPCHAPCVGVKSCETEKKIRQRRHFPCKKVKLVDIR